MVNSYQVFSVDFSPLGWDFVETTIQSKVRWNAFNWGALLINFICFKSEMEWNVCDGSKETFFIELMSCEIARETRIKWVFIMKKAFPESAF